MRYEQIKSIYTRIDSISNVKKQRKLVTQQIFTHQEPEQE